MYRDDGAGLAPVAFLDWDLAAPGDRIHDIAHVCYRAVRDARDWVTRHRAELATYLR